MHAIDWEKNCQRNRKVVAQGKKKGKGKGGHRPNWEGAEGRWNIMRVEKQKVLEVRGIGEKDIRVGADSRIDKKRKKRGTQIDVGVTKACGLQRRVCIRPPKMTLRVN